MSYILNRPTIIFVDMVSDIDRVIDNKWDMLGHTQVTEFIG